MKPQREGIISAMFTDAERVEMATAESRQWYGAGGWADDDGRNRAWMNPTVAYRPRPKPAKPWQDEFEEWAKGRIFTKDGMLFFKLTGGRSGNHYRVETRNASEQFSGEANGAVFACEDWRTYMHEAEEYIEPYTQETLPWPLVVKIGDEHGLVVKTTSTSAYSHVAGFGWITYSELAKYKTPTGEPCGVRKWRKKTEAAK